MQLNIIKRNGSTVPFNLDKIKKVIAWACEGLNVNPLLLESKVTSIFKEGISTRAIQDNLIQSAVTLTSIEEPHWKDVAGRLMMMNVWKETKLSRGYGYENSYEALKDKVDKGIYNQDLVTKYTDEELKEATTWINPALDLNYDFAGMSVLANPNPNKRYLAKDELLQEAYLTQALMLASVENPEERLHWAKEFYYLLCNKKLSLATPFWTSLRKPKTNLASCFIIALDDDLDSIYNGIHKIANISKNGGGVGVNLSRIRANNSWVAGKAKASNGVIPWVKVINDTAVAVDQGGHRAGAVTPSLDSWHLDIIDFLDMQTEHGDPRRKCFDVFPQVVCSDEFMRRVEANKEWTLVDPYEIKFKFGIDLPSIWGKEFEFYYSRIESNLIGEGANPDLDISGITLWKKVNARDLFKQIMKTQIESGLPYIAFKDTINKYNPNKHEGYIPGVNLCVESFSNVVHDLYDHVCNLLSKNLANLTLEEIPNVCRTAVRMLDNAIDLTIAPTQHSMSHNKRYRTIGIGDMGLHDYLAKNNLNYFNGKDEVSKLAETIAFHCFKTSIELAREKGSFEAFEGSELSKGFILGKLFYRNKYILVDDLRKVYKEDTLELASRYSEEKLKEIFEEAKSLGIKVYECTLNWDEIRLGVQQGIRNSQLNAIAPNTTTALIQGCTASILPTFSKFFMEKTSKGTSVMCPPYLSEKFWYYHENKNTDQAAVIDICTEFQKWVDTGISMELVFNLNNEEVDAKHIFERELKAWKQEAKSIYYIRPIDKQKDVDKECSSCAG